MKLTLVLVLRLIAAILFGLAALPPLGPHQGQLVAAGLCLLAISMLPGLP